MQTEEKQMKMSYLIKRFVPYFKKVQMDTDTRSTLCVSDNGL